MQGADIVTFYDDSTRLADECDNFDAYKSSEQRRTNGRNCHESRGTWGDLNPPQPRVKWGQKCDLAWFRTQNVTQPTNVSCSIEIIEHHIVCVRVRVRLKKALNHRSFFTLSFFLHFFYRHELTEGIDNLWREDCEMSHIFFCALFCWISGPPKRGVFKGFK